LYENSNSALLKMRRGNLGMAAGCECFVLREEQKSNQVLVVGKFILLEKSSNMDVARGLVKRSTCRSMGEI